MAFNQSQYRYTNITTGTTTQVFTGAGTIHAITLNTAAAGSIILADSVSTTTPAIATIKASAAEGTYLYDVAVANGLRIITAGATDLTVSWTQG